MRTPPSRPHLNLIIPKVLSPNTITFGVGVVRASTYEFEEDTIPSIAFSRRKYMHKWSKEKSYYQLGAYPQTPEQSSTKLGPYKRKFLLLGLGLSQPRARIGTAPKSAWFCAFSVATLESQILASNGRNGRSNPTHSTRRKGAKSKRDCLLWFKSRMVWVSWPRSSQAVQWSWP